MVAKAINLAMRGTAFLWILLVMSIDGNIIASANHGNPSVINYTIFVAVFAMLSLFYLIPATLKEGLQGHPLIMVGLDVLNTLFLFCAAVAMAAELGAHSCSNESYLRSNKITNGSDNMGDRCREAQATTAFLWFAFAAFAASAVLSFIQGRSSGSGMSAPRRGGPTMRQV